MRKRQKSRNLTEDKDNLALQKLNIFKRNQKTVKNNAYMYSH